MELVFKKDSVTKYQCTICEKYFIWSEHSSWYGLPDEEPWYEWIVSNTQAYKMLGNGWTIDVIKHILSFANFDK